MNARLPPRVVAIRVRRLGQDPTDTGGSTDTGSTDTTGSSTDTGGSTDTTGGSTDTGSGSGTDWLSQLSNLFGGGGSNGSGGGGSTDTNSPATGDPTATNNAAVPVVQGPSAPSGVSPTVIALGVGAVAVTGIAIYAATRGGRSRRRNPARRRRNPMSETVKDLAKRIRAASSEEAAVRIAEAAYKDGKITRVQQYELERVAYASHSQDW